MAKLRMVAALDFHPARLRRQQRLVAHHVGDTRHAIVGRIDLRDGKRQPGEILLLWVGGANQDQRGRERRFLVCQPCRQRGAQRMARNHPVPDLAMGRHRTMRPRQSLVLAAVERGEAQRQLDDHNGIAGIGNLPQHWGIGLCRDARAAKE
jgi:hypothetical protein